MTSTECKYIPPQKSTYDDWAGYEGEFYSPTARQLTIIEAVTSALEAELYYTRDVLQHCIEFLGVTPEQAEVGAKKVEGGDVGMDCYYARGFMRAQKEHEAKRNALLQLDPKPGMKLGTLIFNDYKRNTGMEINAVTDGGKSIHISGKRGRYVVSMVADALQIQNAKDRAEKLKKAKKQQAA